MNKTELKFCETRSADIDGIQYQVVVRYLGNSIPDHIIEDDGEPVKIEDGYRKTLLGWRDQGNDIQIRTQLLTYLEEPSINYAEFYCGSYPVHGALRGAAFGAGQELKKIKSSFLEGVRFSLQLPLIPKLVSSRMAICSVIDSNSDTYFLWHKSQLPTTYLRAAFGLKLSRLLRAAHKTIPTCLNERLGMNLGNFLRLEREVPYFNLKN